MIRPPFRALPDEGNLTIVQWEGVGIIWTKSSGDVALVGNYAIVATCEDLIEDNIPNFEGYIADGSPGTSIFR